jgi:deoxyribodipyrimidine photo-lyase
LKSNEAGTGSAVFLDRFPSSRRSALERLTEFLPNGSRYALERNHVFSEHSQVSRLAPAIRCRLVTEEETVQRVLDAAPFGTVEKFVQEVLWRSYWKGWLEQRPQVWTTYRRRVAFLRQQAPEAVLRRAQEVAAGGSGVALMDRFARELAETGYLHNHARMWWASYWIHVERLPWELGADHFQRHLLDFDPASNTLSWRWVAGLQTPGKTYLVRRSNLEKFAAPELLADSTGLGRLDDDRIRAMDVEEHADVRPVPLPARPERPPESDVRTALWIHEEDGSVELSSLGALGNPILLNLWLPPGNEAEAPSPVAAAWRVQARGDAWSRANCHFESPEWESCAGDREETLAGTLAGLASEHGCRRLVSAELAVGPLADQQEAIHRALNEQGVEWIEVRRSWDASLWPLARKGFFDFWHQVGGRLREAGNSGTAGRSVLETLR